MKKLINKFDFEALDTKIEKSKVIIATKTNEHLWKDYGHHLSKYKLHKQMLCDVPNDNNVLYACVPSRTR